MQAFKKSTSGVLQFWCLSPVRVVYHGSFRENLESSFRGLGLSYVISQLDETHASLQNAAFEMLQFWCLSPVRVAYHGSFRENLGSAFWGLGPHITTWLGRCKSSKRAPLKCCIWCLSPVRVAYHGAFRENLESAFWGVGVSYCSLIRQMQVFKKSTSGVAVLMPFWCLSPVRVVYHGSFRENLESTVLKHMEEHLKCCSFDASPQSEWLITAHLERIWGQHFGALDCHITTWLGRCKSSKRAPLKCCSFDASPLSEWLITAHLERIWSQHFGALGCHIVAWLGRCKSSKKAPLECCSFDAFLMPLPSQSGLSRLI